MLGTVRRALFILGVVGLAATLISPAQPVHAAIITVTTTADGTGGPACTLRDAITAANTNAATGGCGAGNGADAIGFAVTGTITLGSPLPAVVSALIITGPAGGITLSGNHTVRVLGVGAGGALTVQHVTVADGADQIGAGIYNSPGGTLTVTDSTFTGNSAADTGVGGGIQNNGTLTVTSSTFTGNRAGGGGGIQNQGQVTVTNSTFTDNSAAGSGNGGALLSISGALTVAYSTVAANSAGSVGGINVSGGTATLRSTIVANNTGQNCSFPSLADGGYNLENGAGCGFSAPTSMSNTGPRLSPSGLKDNGGPTRTIALQTSSPAIDAIPQGANGCGTTVTADQRGTSRPQPPEGNCDIGAYERIAQGRPRP